jgi:SAM-dependent methyltransferase
MTACPLCSGAAVRPFLRRMTVPVLQNAPAATREIARGRAMGELEISVCERCGFVFNRAFDPARIEYAQSYDNTQCCSPSFERYMRGLAEDLVARHDLHGKRIVEVGCGKGHFLRMVCQIGGNRGFGFDPTYVGPDAVDGGAVSFVRELYSEHHASLAADFVCCRHVLEHVADPLAMLGAVRLATRSDPSTAVFFEVPTVDWILEHTCFWDFFYEHCNYFNPETLSFAFRAAGFDVVRTQPAFEGQYLWLEAHPRPGVRGGALAIEPEGVAASLARIAAFEARVETQFAGWQDRFERAARTGGLAIWGAGAKGVTLVNLLDPGGALVKYVVDINPNKQGTFVPGTGHPVVGPDALARDRVGHVFITNPNYAAEIRAAIAGLVGGELTIDCL